MGSAILSGILDSTVKSGSSAKLKSPITKFIACVQTEASETRLREAYENHSDRLQIVRADNLYAMRTADVVVLACKPYMAESVLGAGDVRDALKGKLLISVLAGADVAQLEGYIYGDSSAAGPRVIEDGSKCCIMRAMPNMAAKIGKSITMIGIPSTPPPKSYADLTAWIFKKVGDTCYIADELFHAGSVLAGESDTTAYWNHVLNFLGATPAFLTVAFDGILDGAVAEGIKRDVAKQILAQSFIGAASLLQEGEHPAVLRESIASPKGTTIQGLLTLEKQGVRSAFSDAFMNSTFRGKNMK